MPQKDTSKSVRYQSLKKEATLTFLALFYFVIATNTQSGWLFLLSAFLIGVLALSWLASRRSFTALEVTRTHSDLPQRGLPWSVRLTLLNTGTRALREILAVEPANTWSQESHQHRWVVTSLPPGESRQFQYQITPARRGEHSLLGTQLCFGAPLGLFGVTRYSLDSPKFLVYPKLLTLPLYRRRTRLSGLLSDFAAPREKGDSRALRALREYHPGDDLRSVHWKSSAKTGGRTLLVKEHTAPSRQLSQLVLDTSGRNGDERSIRTFETTVSLAASMLWTAYREGSRSELIFLTPEGWQRTTRWEQQYEDLARIQQDPTLAFAAWCQTAEEFVTGFHGRKAGPTLLTSAANPEDIGPAADWPQWPENSLLATSAETASAFSGHPVIVVDSDGDSIQEALTDV